MYADRAIIPFFMAGSVVGFCAVDLLGEKARAEKYPHQAKKYRKTLTATSFKVSDYLFGFDDCEEGADELVVVEGPREVMKLWQEGHKNVVAVLGSKICSGQFKLLVELAPKSIMLMFDGDAVGNDATEKMEKKLKRVFPLTIGAYPPVGMDPKNLDGGQIREILKKARKRLERVRSKIIVA